MVTKGTAPLKHSFQVGNAFFRTVPGNISFQKGVFFDIDIQGKKGRRGVALPGKCSIGGTGMRSAITGRRFRSGGEQQNRHKQKQEYEKEQ
jgi:hypothetical protein